MGCCLLDVCGLWLCFPPISVFGVVRMLAGPTVNAPYRSATPQATAAAVKPLRGCRMDEVCTRKGKRGKTSIQARRRACTQSVCMRAKWRAVALQRLFQYTLKLQALQCGGHPSPRRGASCCTAQVNFSSGQVALSGSPMWFHLDRRGLQIQSADSL